MAGIKISALPAVPSALLTDFFPVVQGGVTSRETLQQVATLFTGTFLPLAGGTMTGAINMGGFKIDNMADPTLAQDAATKNYVDNIASGGGAPVVAASTTSLTVTQSGAGVGATLTNAGAQATFALDGQNPTVGQRVLIKNQSGGSNTQNGVYTVTNVGSGATNWVLTRATDYDTPSNINNTGIIPVENGTVNANTGWINTTLMVTVDTTAVTFVQFGASFPVSLANGGTGASLTASNGGIFYSNASTGAILAGTATAGLVLLSGANTTPTWSNFPPFTQVSIQVFNAAGTFTYTKTAKTVFAIVEAGGAGGGSGGAAGAAGQMGASAGGGGGGYSKTYYTAAELGTGGTCVIGAGGAAGTAGNNAGGTGGTTSFTPQGIGGIAITGAGGTGGGGSPSSASTTNSAAAGTGGSFSGGIVDLLGGNGTVGVTINGVSGLALPGEGGGCPGISTTATNYALTTVAVNQNGQGAPGVLSYTNANQAGQAGAQGIVIITEFISS